MIEVKPGQKIPLSYVFAAGDVGKVVKARLEQMDGTVLTTITLTEVQPGDHSDASYAMPVGPAFLKIVYRPYLSDGTTLDTTNPITQDMAAVITPVLVDRLGVVVGCADQPAQVPVLVPQGSDKDLLLSFMHEDGTAFDTAAATAVTMRIRKANPVYQVDTLQASTLTAAHVYSFRIQGVLVSYTAAGPDTQELVLAGLLAALLAAFPDGAPVVGVVAGSGPSATLTLTAHSKGQNLAYEYVDADLSYANVAVNYLEKTLLDAISPVSGAIGQYIVQMTIDDFRLLPDGDNDVQAEVDLAGVRHVMQVHGAITIEPSAI